jgi:Ser-tRNA(Ala) deacylase AlaX
MERPENRLYLMRPFDLEYGTVVSRCQRGSDSQCRIWLQESLFEPLNPEGGDRGQIVGTSGIFNVSKVSWDGRDRSLIHSGELRGTISEGEHVIIKVDPELRHFNSCYHSASHLLTSVAREICNRDMIGKLKLMPDSGLLVLFGQADRLGTAHEVVEASCGYLGRSCPIRIVHLDAQEAVRRCGEFFVGVVPRSLLTWRVMEIENTFFRPIPCGGVHLRDLNALRSIQLLEENAVGDDLHIQYHCVFDPPVGWSAS